MKRKQLLNLFLLGLISCGLLTTNAQAQKAFGSVTNFQDDSPFPSGDDDSPFAQEESPFPDEPGVDAELPKPPAQDRTIEDDLPERFSSNDVSDSQEQNIMINSRYAGWQGAAMGAGDDRVGDELRANWLMVDNNGRFEGKVIPGEGADVSRMNVFLMNMGRLVKQTALDESGRFEFNNVRQGAYALVGWGDKGFFAFGVNILASNPKAVGEIKNRITVTAFQNRTTINTDWISHYSAQVAYRVYGRYPVGEGPDDPARLYGFRGLVNNFPDGIPATSISSHRVETTADGRLVGRVHQMNSISGRPVDVRTTKVLLLQGDDVVASTSTDNYGVFEFQQVPSGSYGVVAAGVDGVGLIGITVGDSKDAMNDQGVLIADGEYPIDFTLVSSETMGWLNHYANEVAYRRGLLAPRPPKPSRAIADAGLGGGVCNHCGNQAGGCNACQQQYLLSACRQRGLTFEQWQQYCQGRKLPGHFSFSDLGNGALVDRTADRIRKSTNRLNGVFDRAFYPSESEVNQLLQDAIRLERQFEQFNAPRRFAPQAQPFGPQQALPPQAFGAPRAPGASLPLAPQVQSPTYAMPDAPSLPSIVAPGSAEGLSQSGF